MANRINLGAVKGETGAQGAQGLTGASGQDGVTPHIENGYWYIGTVNQNVKAKGDTWYKGTGAPTDQGVNGDYYIDTATNDVYYKQNNVWGLATNIKGEQGEQGEQGENATSISIGTITTLAHGEQATAELVPLGNGAYQLNLGIPEGAQGEQGEQGVNGNTTAYVGGFAVNTLNFDSDPQAQIDSKLDRNQGSANAGKILTVNSNGDIVPTTSTAEDDVIDAYIVGSDEFESDWLSLTAGGEALTPTQGKIYVIKTAGDYYLLQYVWTGSEYEQTGGGDTSGLALKTEAVGSIVMSIDSSTYVVTLQAKDVNGTNIGTAQTIDLPLESVVVNGSYNSLTKELTLTLQNGTDIDIDISDIVDGLQNEITVNNKLSADLVDDTSTTNKFVTASDKTAWNGNTTAISGILDGSTIDSFADVETALLGKQDVMQYSTMPTASVSNVGAIVQYTGATTNDYTSGHFYKCIENSGNYGWEEIEFGGSAPANMVTTDTTQTITAKKIFEGKVVAWSSLGIHTNGKLGLNYYSGSYNVDNQYFVFDYNGIHYYGSNNAEFFNLKDCISIRSSLPTTIDNSWISRQGVVYYYIGATNETFTQKHFYKVDLVDGSYGWVDVTPSSAPTVLTNTSASTWVADSTYTDYGYKCVLSVSGVTASDLVEVVFGVTEATSGNYAPVAESGAGTITIYSKVDDTITIPTIKVEKL